MTTTTPAPLLFALDDLDAFAWMLQYPELADAVVWLPIDSDTLPDHEDIGEVMITLAADAVSAGTPLVKWVIDHVRYLASLDERSPVVGAA